MAVARKPTSKPKAEVRMSDSAATAQAVEAAELRYVAGATSESAAEIYANARLEQMTQAGRVVVEIELNELDDQEGLQERHDVDTDLRQLVDSLREHGQLQPILVTRRSDGAGHQVIAGRRRIRALRELARDTGASIRVKAILVAAADRVAELALQITENLHRKDPTFLDYVLALMDLPDEERWKVADRAGYTPSQISHLRRVARDIPQSLARLLGSARGIGRDQLFKLGDLCVAVGPARVEEILEDRRAELAAIQGDDQRFAKILSLLKARRVSNPIVPETVALYASPAVEMKETRSALTLIFDRKLDADFAAHMRNRLPEILDQERQAFQAKGERSALG